MEAELAGLAATGATTVVGLMASDAWAQVRARLARFLARGGAAGPDGEAAEAQLERSRDELAADAAVADDVRAEWRMRLRRVLQADPAAADELRRLLAELSPAAGGVTVHNTVSGGVHHGPVIQIGTSVTHYGPAGRGHGPEPAGGPAAGEAPGGE